MTHDADGTLVDEFSPLVEGDEAIWDWAREDVRANTCLETRAKVQENRGEFFGGLVERTAEVKQRCRTELHARPDAFMVSDAKPFPQRPHVDSTLALV